MSLKEYFDGLRDERSEAVKKIVKATGKSQASVSRWISGENKPDKQNQIAICRALGLSRKEIFND